MQRMKTYARGASCSLRMRAPHRAELLVQSAGRARGVSSARAGKAGTLHAEVHALAMVGDPRTVRLPMGRWPCSHHGRTGAFAPALAAGGRRVVAAMLDPESAVAGKGKAMLEAAGVE